MLGIHRFRAAHRGGCGRRRGGLRRPCGGAQAPAPGRYISWAPPAVATATPGAGPALPLASASPVAEHGTARRSDNTAVGALQATERQHGRDREGPVLVAAGARERPRSPHSAVPEMGHGRPMNAGRSESRGATSCRTRRKAPGRPPQRRDHRARRPRQDDARRRAAEAIARLRGPRAGRRIDHGFQRPRAREGDHDPRQDHVGPLQRGQAQHHRHPGARGLRRRGRAGARDGGRLPACSSTPPRARCRRRGWCSVRRWRSACSRSSSSTRSTAPTPSPPRRSRQPTTCSSSSPRTSWQLDAPVLYTNAREGTATADLTHAGRHPRATPRRHPRARSAAARGPGRPAADAGQQPRSRQLERPARAGADPARHRPPGPERGVLHRRRVRARSSASPRSSPSRRCNGCPVESATAGEIVYLSGLAAVAIGDTIADADHPGGAAAPRDRRADPAHAVLGQPVAARGTRGDRQQHVTTAAGASASASCSPTSRCASRTDRPPTSST